MNTKTILLISFFTGLLFTIIGALLMILHYEETDPFLIIGILSSLVFIVTAIYEVLSSSRISKTEKVLWTIGFICMSGLIGIIYLLADREKVVVTS